MPRAGKRGRYHHGDLRTALIEVAIELIAESGVRDFSVAEASRRLGVAASAPYAHFADRDELLAAVTVRAYERLLAEIRPALDGIEAPADRLAAMARGYVRFAATNRALFEVLYEAGVDKAGHPEIGAAEQPLTNDLLDCVRVLTGSSDLRADSLATAIEAAARGFALLLLDGDFGAGTGAVEQAAEQAARTTMAIVSGRDLLTGPAGQGESP
jgi:AcrR family transcriptional regulator